MKAKALKSDAFFKSRNKGLLGSYKKAIGSSGGLVMVMVLVLEALCFAADLMAFSLLFGQVMGDTKGLIAAASISLLFPVVAFFAFQGISGRFHDQRKRENLAIALLVVMAVFMVAVLAIRFPLEAVATSDEGADWLITAVVYCLPPIASVIGAFAASLILHNPQVTQKMRTAELRAKIANVKAELTALEGNDPAKLRRHVTNVYRAAYCEIDGMTSGSVFECVGPLVRIHGMDVHDHVGRIVEQAESGTDRYDTRPAAFAPKTDGAANVEAAQNPGNRTLSPEEVPMRIIRANVETA